MSSILRVFFRRFKNFLFRLSYYSAYLLPINKKLITFVSESRDELSGNLQFLNEELNRPEYPFVRRFFLKKTIAEPKSLSYLLSLGFSLGRSRYIIIDDFLPRVNQLRIRKKADLVQLWHAVGAFKKFGYSRMGLPGGPSKNSKHHKNYTMVFVSSQSVVRYYSEGFSIDEGRIFPFGVPRTDLFFDRKKIEKIRKLVYSENRIPIEKKIILFAPTFRGKGQRSADYNFDWIDLKLMYDSLYKQGYFLILKFHPFINRKIIIPKYMNDFIIDLSDYREINNLLFVADILITDYSSVIFEFGLLGKKQIFYAPDLEEYVSSRGFYQEYEKFVPGRIAKDMSTLIHCICTENDELTSEKVTNFNKTYMDNLDGNSSKRIAQFLFKNI